MEGNAVGSVWFPVSSFDNVLTRILREGAARLLAEAINADPFTIVHNKRDFPPPTIG